MCICSFGNGKVRALEGSKRDMHSLDRLKEELTTPKQGSTHQSPSGNPWATFLTLEPLEFTLSVFEYLNHQNILTSVMPVRI